jgi:general secretion pathway protein B
MSFISEALRKSEQGRQRSRGFGTVGRSAHALEGDSSSFWRWILVAILVALVAVLFLLASLLWKEYHAPPPAAIATPSSTPTPAATRPLTELVDDTANGADPQPPSIESNSIQSAADRALSSDDLKPLRQTAPGASTPNSVQNLKLQLIMYDKDQAKRFVIINSQKYTEGQSLKEGPIVEQVTPNGAVLTFQGNRFLLTP